MAILKISISSVNSRNGDDDDDDINGDSHDVVITQPI